MVIEEQHGLSNFTDSISNCRRSRMVFDCGTSGDLCGSGDPDRHNGHSSGDRKVGDCVMVAPELEDSFIMDEILSDLISVSVDGDNVSGYLRFSLQGTS